MFVECVCLLNVCVLVVHVCVFVVYVCVFVVCTCSVFVQPLLFNNMVSNVVHPNGG